MILLVLPYPAEAIDLHLELISDQFQTPTYVIAPPNDHERLFVVAQHPTGENTSYVWIIKNGLLLPQPFLAISPVTPGFSGPALCLEFDPDFETNNYVYLKYIDDNEPAGDVIVSRFTVSANPNQVDPASERQVIKIEQPHSFHPGGWLGFGPDGYLYISSGDGGKVNYNANPDPDRRGQDLNSPLGKILRIDVTHDEFPADPNRYYAIPPDNPFVNQAGLDEIWAYGLREPWRCSFDSLTGDLYIGDVGQSEWEEVNIQDANSPGGENYGWRCKEGTETGPGTVMNDPECSGQTFVDPVNEYPILSLPECSITGGYVYRGSAIPELYGRYLFADWCTSRIWSFRYVNGTMVDFQEQSIVMDDNPAPTLGQINSFGQDACGELYLMTNSGQLFSIVPDTPAVLIGDINNSWKVDFTDYAIFAGQWAKTTSNNPADFDNNQIVNIDDAGLLTRFWLTCCPTAPLP